MKIFNENDVVRLQAAVESEVIGERRVLQVPEGTLGTVVLVLGDPMHPQAYEVEIFIQEQSCYVLATVDASLVTAANIDD